MRGRAVRRGPLLYFPAPSARGDRKQWSRSAFMDAVDVLTSSLDPHQDRNQQKEKKEQLANSGRPGFRGSECPAVADIHILCHVFQHVPWSSSMEKHLRCRNFSLTTHQVALVLHKLKDNLTHTFHFFIWASQQRGYCPSAECFEILKNAIDTHIDDVHPMLQDMKLNGYFIPLDVLILLMEVFAEKNMVQHALEVFQSLTKFGSRPDEDAYNIILQILVDAGCIDAALETFEQMKKDKWCRPGSTAFSLVLWSLGKVAKIAEARNLLGSLKSSSNISIAKAHSQFVGGLCEGGWMDQAEEDVIEMYEHGIKPDTEVYMNLISGHKKAGRLSEARRYYVEAVKDGLIEPSSGILRMLILGFCQQNDAEAANELLMEMKSTGLSLDATVYAAVIQCASKQGQWQLGQMLLNDLAKEGISTTVEMYSAVLTDCVNAGQFDMAISCLLQMMREEHICTEEAMVPDVFQGLIEIYQPETWMKLLLAIEGMEKSVQASLCRLLVSSLIKADTEVADKVFKLMAERGLYQS